MVVPAFPKRLANGDGAVASAPGRRSHLHIFENEEVAMRFRCFMLCALLVAGSAGIAAANGDATCPPTSAIINIPADLPYTDATLDTCGLVDDVNNSCLGSYDGGEDGFYTLNVTAETCVQLANDLSWGGLAVATSCDFVSCEASGGSSAGAAATATLSPGTYYVMHDTWPSPPCDAGTFTIVECLPPPPNDTCVSATDIAPPFTDTPDATTALPDQDVSCNSTSNPETAYGVWYHYVPTTSGTLDVTETSSNDVVTVLFTGADCGSLTEVSCLDVETPASFAVTGGTEYWILVGRWGTTPPSGVYDLTFSGPVPVELQNFVID